MMPWHHFPLLFEKIYCVRDDKFRPVPRLEVTNVTEFLSIVPEVVFTHPECVCVCVHLHTCVHTLDRAPFFFLLRA